MTETAPLLGAATSSSLDKNKKKGGSSLLPTTATATVTDDVRDDEEGGFTVFSFSPRALKTAARVGAVSVVMTLVIVAGYAGAGKMGGTPFSSAQLGRGREAAQLGSMRGANRIEVSAKHKIGYCNTPKVASSTLTTYMTGLCYDIDSFKGVEQFILSNGGGSHFDYAKYRSYAAVAPENYTVFLVTRHPGTRLYSTWFDKIHAHQGVDQPDLLQFGCSGNPRCTFEDFLNGMTHYVHTQPEINEHVRPQSWLCDPQEIHFQLIYKIEDGFDGLAARLAKWTGVNFDFTSEDGKKGYSHHSAKAEALYDQFDVNDAEAYERLMPFDLQWKIYLLYKRDFDLFGYSAPVRRPTQLAKCPTLPFAQELSNTKWVKEDLQTLYPHV